MLSSRWPRSPSHGKCSRRFCGSSRSYGRSHHPRQHEAFDCHAFKRNRQEECVQMPVKIARSTPRPSFGLRELLVASHISRLASRDAAKSLLSTLVSESSGECRLIFARQYGRSLGAVGQALVHACRYRDPLRQLAADLRLLGHGIGRRRSFHGTSSRRRSGRIFSRLFRITSL